MIDSRASDILSALKNVLKKYAHKKKFQFFFLYPERTYAQRIFIFIIDPYYNEPKFVAKVPLDEISDSFFKNTFENLTFLYDKFKNHPLLSSIPKPEFYGKIDSFNILIEKFLQGKKVELFFSFRNSKHLLNLFVNWLIDFNHLTKDLVNLDIQLIRREFESRFNLLFENLGAPKKLKPFFSCSLEKIQRISGEKIPILFCHGDFAIRNFILNNTKLSVIDWEHSQRSSLALLDMFHLCLFSIWQLEKCSFDKCLTKAFVHDGEYNNLFRPLIRSYLNALEIESFYLLPSFLAYLSHWSKYLTITTTKKVKEILENLADKKIELKFL